MNKFISTIDALFLITCVWVIPLTILRLWDMAISPSLKPGAIQALVPLFAWLLVGITTCLYITHLRRQRLLKKANAVAPARFDPMLRLIGAHDSTYFAVSPKHRCVVIVDVRRNIARCEALEFVQSWTFDENRKEGSFVTFCFNSYDFSSIKIWIPASQSFDIAAKLNMVFCD